MKQLVILCNKIPKFKDAEVHTFKEELEKYKRSCRKSYLRTEACFSWKFDSTLEDLKKSIFVYPKSKESYKWIKTYYKVIEENEI